MNDILDAISAVETAATSGRSGLRDFEVQGQDLGILLFALPTLQRRGVLSASDVATLTERIERTRSIVTQRRRQAMDVVRLLVAEHAPDLGLEPVESPTSAAMLVADAAMGVADDPRNTILSLHVDEDVSTVWARDVERIARDGREFLAVGARNWAIDDVVAVRRDDPNSPGLAMMMVDETIVQLIPA